MKAEKVVYERLTTHAGVSGLVGTRVYPLVLPQNPTYPCIMYQRVSSSRVQGVHSDPGMAQVTVRIVCLDHEYNDVKALAEQVRLALERYGSSIAGTLIAGVNVYDILMGSEADAYEEDLDVFSHSLEFTIIHQE